MVISWKFHLTTWEFAILQAINTQCSTDKSWGFHFPIWDISEKHQLCKEKNHNTENLRSPFDFMSLLEGGTSSLQKLWRSTKENKTSSLLPLSQSTESHIHRTRHLTQERCTWTWNLSIPYRSGFMKKEIFCSEKENWSGNFIVTGAKYLFYYVF